MIVRTYSRRSRPIGRSPSDPSLADVGAAVGEEEGDLREPFFFSQPPEGSQERCLLFSSQDSSPWSLEPDEPLLISRSRAQCSKKGGLRRERSCSGAKKNPTATLMEAQEFGEMMEHVDEVTFALDGLRRGQPLGIRRSSLLSLLSVCESAQQRRLLRAQGMVKTIMDAILDLNLDDESSSVAAATFLYLLASDAQDDRLLDSSPSIQFLLKLLNPPVLTKALSIGCKLISLRKPPIKDQGVDSSSNAIFSKVQEILVSEVKSGFKNTPGIRLPELSSKWIALLTMEKACFSAVSFEDTSDVVRKVGGTFKERLRELGGLDMIFDIIISCYYKMERWFKESKLPDLETTKGDALQSSAFLLKSLKIIENATFMSEDNQKHLLCMKVNSKFEGLFLSFVGVIIKSIELLSALSLLPSACAFGHENHLSKVVDIYCSGAPENMDKRCRKEPCKKRQRVSVSQSEASTSISEMTTSMDSIHFCDREDHSSASVSGTKEGIGLNVASRGLGRGVYKGMNGWNPIKSHGSKMKLGSFSGSPRVSDFKRDCVKNDYDPFAFDEIDVAPSKWELLSKKKIMPPTSDSTASVRTMSNIEYSETFTTHINGNTSEESNKENTDVADLGLQSVPRKDSTHLEDCLLTAIKVLMNLTNDNPVGCQQIAHCGGLDILASLIISHFPSFDMNFYDHFRVKETVLSSKSDAQGDLLNSKHFSDHELDLLVAILGLLVNLVEKDNRNRSRLASARVLHHRSGRSEGKENHVEVIPLLCSIFLANWRNGGTADDEKDLVCDDETSLLQGQREAEMMIIEAYAALLLAFLSTESTKTRESIASFLPNCNLQVLVPVLEKFVTFHLSLNMISPETHSVVVKVIESCKSS